MTSVIRIMTFNLRFENDRDGPNVWSQRRDLLIETITHWEPDIVGTQEGTLNQLDYLQHHLSGYRMHAPQRVEDETCQYPTLFYRQSLFRARAGEEFWLSRTPRLHRSKDWDSAFPRMISCGLFEDLMRGERIWLAVTHLDHIGSQARTEQARIIGRWLQGRSGPCIVMGDFNDAPGSLVHRLLTGPEVGLLDTWQVLGREETDTSMTYHGFLGVPSKTRMDWILVSSHFEVAAASIVRDHRQGRYPSDHFPYVADLRLVKARC